MKSLLPMFLVAVLAVPLFAEESAVLHPVRLGQEIWVCGREGDFGASRGLGLGLAVDRRTGGGASRKGMVFGR